MGLLSLSALALLSLDVGGGAAARRLPVAEQSLVTIVSEPQNDLEHHITLALGGDGGIVEVVRRSAVNHTAASADEFLRGRVSLAGRAAVFLSCPGCDPQTGGRLLLEYLSNGMTGTYSSRALRLDRTGGSFRLLTLDGRPVLRLRLTARRVLGLLIGIGDVVVE
jgi:hypothetical protein